MQAIFCAEPGCRWHTEKKGGNFVYSLERRCFLCDDCFHHPPLPTTCKDLWNFTTTHFNGEPIEVKGIKHLRQLEQQYGCSSHAANYDQAHWDTPPPVKPFPMEPHLAEMISHRTAPERRR